MSNVTSNATTSHDDFIAYVMRWYGAAHASWCECGGYWRDAPMTEDEARRALDMRLAGTSLDVPYAADYFADSTDREICCNLVLAERGEPCDEEYAATVRAIRG
jgi:hypothetical protein